MNKQWISVTEAVANTGKSEATIRRLVNEHKKNIKIINKDKGKIYINADYIETVYPFTHNSQKTVNDSIEHQKDLAVLTLDKQQQDIIKELIHQREKKSYLSFYITIGFILLIALILGAGWLYRAELLNNNKIKISNITESSQKEIKTLNSSYEKELKSLNTQLLDTRKSSAVLLAEIKTTYNKLTDSQTKALDKKEKEIENLQKKLEDINKKIEMDKLFKQ